MIILIEPQCVGWQHESVNAGFIEGIKKNAGEETVKVYAEREHIRCLRQLLPDMEKEIFFHEIEVSRKDTTATFPIYYRLFRKILCNKENVDVRAVVLLSCHKGNLTAIGKMARAYKRTKFCIVMHAIAEQLVNKERIPRYTFIPFKKILETFSVSNNVTLITYSPLAKEALSNVLSREMIDRIVFFHHPFPTQRQDTYGRDEDGKIHIAIVGAGVRKDVHDLIKSVDRDITGRIVFDMMERSEIDFSDLKSVRVWKKGDDITNVEIVQMIGKSQFVFLPYTDKEYQVSCSGILIDAIRQAVPILSFDSRLLVWYNQYHIGKVCSSYEEMREYLMRLCDGRDGLWPVYQRNIAALRKRIIAENDGKIKQLMQSDFFCS